MIRLARSSVRNPRLALLAWAIVAIALSLVGLGLTGSLSPSITTVAGSQSARAQHLADTQFGPSVLIPILLEGPKQDLDRQGPALVRALGARTDTRVLSAWDAGAAGKQLRPSPTAAMVVASVSRSEKDMVRTYQAQIDRIVAKTTGGPVHVSVTGQPTIDRAMKDQSISTTRTSMAWSLPIIFLVLLLLLRAPVAAGAITILAAATTFAGFGEMTILGKVLDTDAIAVIVGAMTGLALSVGYALLIYRRWEESGVEAVRTTGRAILVGGTAIVLALLIAPMVADMKILTSMGIGLVVVGTLSIGAAVVVMPAFLTLAGERVHALRFGTPGPIAHAWERLSHGDTFVIRRAAPVGAVATAVLCALALPLLSLQTGPPGVKTMLKPSDPARTSYERIANVMGPGWPTPYNIVLVSRGRPVTDPALLRKLDRFETALSKDRRVASVVGPGQLSATSHQLDALPKQLKGSAKMLKTAPKDLGRLQNGLGQAGAGVAKLKSGLSEAAGGAGLLQGGSGKAQGGAGQLHAGLAKARDGAGQISAGLIAALSGARKLRDGAGAALDGSRQIRDGLSQAAPGAKGGLPVMKQMSADVQQGDKAMREALASSQGVTAQIDAALAKVKALPDSGDAVAALQAAQSAASGVTSTLNGASVNLQEGAGISQMVVQQTTTLAEGLGKLYAGSQQLTAGIGKLSAGNSALASGINKLAGGGGQLTTGMNALTDGAAQLEAGLGQLTGGAGQLASGLSSSGPKLNPLLDGLGQMKSGVAKFRTQLPSPKDIERLNTQSPGLFSSGYFVLAAVAGAPDRQREQASFVVNLKGGGTAGQITVIAKNPAESPVTQQLGHDLIGNVVSFARANHLDAAVGGPGGAFGDFNTQLSERIWPVVILASLAVTLLLMAMLRSVVLPLVAVAFDLLTAAATFGVLKLAFGTLDPASIIGVFTMVFGVTAVYEVQLLHRAREVYLETHAARDALRAGMRDTAAAGTGAAVAMLAAIIPFALTDITAVRVFGFGVALAILFDALIVRPVLLPAAVEMLERRGYRPSAPPLAPPTARIGGTPA